MLYITCTLLYSDVMVCSPQKPGSLLACVCESSAPRCLDALQVPKFYLTPFPQYRTADRALCNWHPGWHFLLRLIRNP